MIEEAGLGRAAVLVIAQDLLFSERCRRFLEAQGFRVTDVHDWWLGVRRAAIEKPDLVIVDGALAELDGLSVLAVLKAHPTTSRLRVVVAVDRDRDDLRLRAHRLGAQALVLKSDLNALRLASYLAW